MKERTLLPILRNKKDYKGILHTVVTNKSDNLDKIDKLLERHKLLEQTQEKQAIRIDL